MNIINIGKNTGPVGQFNNPHLSVNSLALSKAKKARLRRHKLLASSLVTAFALLAISLVASPTKTTSVSTAILGKQQTNNNQAQGNALSSTNSQPDNKTCTPAKSYTKPREPQALSWSNQVNLSETVTSHYKVYGDTTEQIASQIYSCTPVQHNKRKYAASTDYAINWAIQYTRVVHTNQCTVSSAGVGLSIAMVYPAWSNSGTADSTTKKEWKDFITHLEEHEEEHKAINIHHANRLLSSLRNLPTTDCDSIQQLANTTATSVVKQLDKQNIEFDKVTNHGATQGAKL